MMRRMTFFTIFTFLYYSLRLESLLLCVTIFIYSKGDHGELWEGGTRVPSFISSRTLVVNHYVFQGLFHAVDWLPTILSVAGGEIPVGIDGVDQWPALRDRSLGPRSEMVYNIDLNQSAIRVGDFKLIQSRAADASDENSKESDEYHLYNLAQDPGENEDLASKAPKKLEEMKARLDQLRQTLVPAEDKPPTSLKDHPNYDRVWASGWC